jgi:hypothetical protein
MKGIKMKTVFVIAERWDSDGPFAAGKILKNKNGTLMVFSSILEAEQYAIAYVGGNWQVFMF